MSKAKKQATSSQPARDLIGFVLLAIAVFVMLSLLSYSPLDPSWNTTYSTGAVPIHNYCGLLGSYVADALMQIFGYASFSIPLGLLALIWGIVFRGKFGGVLRRLTGFVLGVLSLSLFLEIVAGGAERVPAWGGVSGLAFRSFLATYVGHAGALIMAGTLFVISLVLTVGFTFVRFLGNARGLAAVLGRLGHFLHKQLRRTGSVLDRLMAKGEKEFRKGLEAITSEKEPRISPSKKLRIAGEEIRKPEKKPAPGPVEKKEIPIVLGKAAATQQLPSFHTIDEEVSDKTAREKKPRRSYRVPDITLLDAQEDQALTIDRDELFRNAQLLERKLKDFGVFGKVVEVQPGPVITMYEFEPAPGVKVNQITRLNDDLALALKALSVRITPLPGKSVIGIEVANRQRQVVYLKDIIGDDHFDNSASKLTLAIGKDTAGIPVTTNLRKMPHLLVAGATGSGKSVSINSMIVSVLYKSNPDDVRMILVDPKMLELSFYDGIPHLLLPVVTDPRKAAAALRWAVHEMERRYRLMADLGVRNIDGYNRKVNKVMAKGGVVENQGRTEPEVGTSAFPLSPEVDKREEHSGPMPLVMIVIDELADLMMVASREVEESIIRLAQMARAAGIHLILATQRPSVDVITGVIKANMPARISFQVSSKIDSRTILDANGAELLLGAGDMLYLPPGTSKLQRIHGAFVTDNEVKRVTDFWKAQGSPDYDHEILKVQAEKATEEAISGEDEEMYQRALDIVRTHRVASISMIQRKLRIGYNRAARIVERMDDDGLLSPGEVGKPREVLGGRLEL